MQLTNYLAGFPHLSVMHRWPVTPNRARIVLSRDRKINMQLNTNS